MNKQFFAVLLKHDKKYKTNISYQLHLQFLWTLTNLYFKNIKVVKKKLKYKT